MLTLTPNIYANLYTPNLKQNTQKGSVNTYVSAPAFKGNRDITTYYSDFDIKNVQKDSSRPPFKDCTVKRLDSVYNDYQKDLHETSKADIKNSVMELSKDFPRAKVLEAMQKATQFGNMRSIDTIGFYLDRDDVGIIANDGIMSQSFTTNKPYKKELKNNFGLNTTLNYLLAQKGLHQPEGKNYAIFLDKDKLEHLENCKKENEENFNALKNNKNIKFFVISGWDNGINFMNRTKNLTETTRELLNKSEKEKITIDDALNKDILDKSKSLGIKPIIIKNINDNNINTIYEQLRPEQISRKELNAVLDATVMDRMNDCNMNRQSQGKDVLSKYLDKKLTVYTPETLAEKSKEIYKNIEKFAKSKGKTMDDVLYLIPQPEKSYDFVNYQYQLVNNVPQKQFVNCTDINWYPKSKENQNKIFAIIDDCSLSGSSLVSAMAEEDMMNYSGLSENNNVVIAPMYMSDYAEKSLNDIVKGKHRKDKDLILRLNPEDESIEELAHDVIERYALKKTLGEAGWKNDSECLIFPYMCPDNNSEFAANIGVFHNINYRVNDNHIKGISIPITNIKTLHNTGRNIARLTDDLLDKEQD